MSNTDIRLAPIEGGLKQLEKYKLEGNFHGSQEDLDWEIKLYEWILRQPDALEKADQYMSMRFSSRNGLISKRTAVRLLGWTID